MIRYMYLSTTCYDFEMLCVEFFDYLSLGIKLITQLRLRNIAAKLSFNYETANTDNILLPQFLLRVVSSSSIEPPKVFLLLRSVL